jgi:peptidoglycan/xylan/chitin deacetylase (PgdA/CDA1 family)
MRTIKDLYTSAEEYNPLVVDSFERFRSCLSANPDRMEPVLSRYLHAGGFRPVYKDDKKYAVCLSHDVDLLYDRKSTKTAVLDSLRALKNGRPGGSVTQLKNIVRPQLKASWLLDQFIDLEEKYKIPATYYFLALDPGEEDFNYTLESVKPYMQRITDNGSEIGLHGGHRAFNSKEKIAAEKDKLERAHGMAIKGYRNHFLRFKTPHTWNHLSQLGFVYDTTFGYPDQPGYRNGLCYPFRPFDLNTNSFIDLLELPLITMDVTFWKYMGLDMDSAFTLFKKLAADVKKVNGVLTILWHNNCLSGAEGSLYKRIFDHIVRDDEAWFASSMELALFWKEKNGPVMEEMIKAGFDSRL